MANRGKIRVFVGLCENVHVHLTTYKEAYWSFMSRGHLVEFRLGPTDNTTSLRSNGLEKLGTQEALHD